eukprot:14188913-Alexandrium_andersonii.AAC.1
MMLQSSSNQRRMMQPPKDGFERAHPLAYPRPQVSAKRAVAQQGGKVCMRTATANVLTLHAGPRPRG